MRAKFLKTLLVPVFVTALAACSSNPVIYHTEELSRDYTYLDISQNSSSYIVESQVGGEHQSIYKILGFKGERFTISIESIDGEAMHSLDGDGFRVFNYYSDEEKNIRVEEVEVTTMDTWVTFSLYAHPQAEYKLTVTKL